MSKGSRRRPMTISEEEWEKRWRQAFDPKEEPEEVSAAEHYAYPFFPEGPNPFIPKEEPK